MEGWRLQRVTKVFIKDLKLAFPLSYVLQKLVVQVEIARLTFPAQKYDSVETEHQMHGFLKKRLPFEKGTHIQLDKHTDNSV